LHTYAGRIGIFIVHNIPDLFKNGVGRLDHNML